MYCQIIVSGKDKRMPFSLSCECGRERRRRGVRDAVRGSRSSGVRCPRPSRLYSTSLITDQLPPPPLTAASLCILAATGNIIPESSYLSGFHMYYCLLIYDACMKPNLPNKLVWMGCKYNKYWYSICLLNCIWIKFNFQYDVIFLHWKFSRKESPWPIYIN